MNAFISVLIGVIAVAGGLGVHGAQAGEIGAGVTERTAPVQCVLRGGRSAGFDPCATLVSGNVDASGQVAIVFAARGALELRETASMPGRATSMATGTAIPTR